MIGLIDRYSGESENSGYQNQLKQHGNATLIV